MDFLHPIEAVIPGARGKVLAVLAETTAELNLRTVARLAGVSVAQVSRVMPDLVELGMVERREVPPSSQFRLARQNVAAEAILLLSDSRESALRQIGEAAAGLPIPPLAIIVYGSLARGQAGRDSDVDAVIVRPDEVSEEADTWGGGIEQWRQRSRTITGNRVEMIEVSLAEARKRVRRKTGVWHDIVRDGVPVFGLSLAELAKSADA